MLKELYIKNVAVIDEAVIEFENGFNVLTGETGAGKSILIDSINMVTGSRTGRDIVRSGAEKAVVRAVFEVKSKAVLEKLSDMGIEPEDDYITLSRQISAEGKSVCRIEGVMMPLSEVREIGELLVDIHGQHDNQKIMNRSNHIDFLDSYGNYSELILKYKKVYEKYRTILKQLGEYTSDKEERERKQDLLAFQINEIEVAKLKKGEDDELAERSEFLANAEKIISGTESAYEALYGNENSSSAFDLIMTAAHALDGVKEYDMSLGDYAERLNSAMAEIEDITSELKNYLDKTDYSEQELDYTEERLSLINGLKRKYGATIDDINTYLDKISEEYERNSKYEENTELLLKEKEETEAALKNAAKELTEARKAAAKTLEQKIAAQLYDLDMPKVTLKVLIENEEFTANGCDKVEFLISANEGEGPKPMTKIASGGELSRIMLAIKSVMNDFSSAETMIFDEIDTGVSGRAAQKIAEKIAAFSDSAQIFAVTHLAQIAAMADTHFLIYKESRDGKTYTSVTKLDKEGRCAEIGRIVGGVSVTETTLKSAEEMLLMADSIKKRKAK